MLIITKTIVHWTEDMNIQFKSSSSRAFIRHYSYCTPLVLLTKPFYWVPVEDMNFYKVVIRSRSYIDHCTRVYIEKPFYYTRVIVKAWFHERFFLAKCELFLLFLLNCDHSNKLFLLDCSQFKRNRRIISYFAKKKGPWNQAFMS
jgi:hypothetical protein